MRHLDMGGKGKLSIVQVEKRQLRVGEPKAKKKGEDEEKRKPRSPPGIIAPDTNKPEVLEAIKKLRVLTPYVVAKQFNLQLSIAKEVLRQLETNGVVEKVAGNHTLKIYAVKPTK
jgi:small subunit ribosomal protein S25e